MKSRVSSLAAQRESRYVAGDDCRLNPFGTVNSVSFRRLCHQHTQDHSKKSFDNSAYHRKNGNLYSGQTALIRHTTEPQERYCVTLLRSDT